MLHAPTTILDTTKPQAEPKLREQTPSALPSDPSLQQNCYIANYRNMTNHSNNKLGEMNKLINLDRCRVPNMENNERQLEYERRCPLTVEESDRCELHKKEDVYGNESIIRKRVEVDIYGGARRAANLKFKCVRDAQEWMEAVGRTMGVRVRAVAVLTLCLAMLATCSAAPARPRNTRNTHLDKSVRNYLEKFGYLSKDSMKVANLVMGEGEYEDDFRIAVKTLQEYGGIPVTGDVDEATLELMGKRRCGRPDVEPGPTGHRRKRFAVQGEKWKHTNLTWSLSSFRRPSQLEPGHTRSVLARALDVWGQASRLTFTEINSDEADIVVSFAKRYHDDAYPFDGRGSILAHAFFPGSGKGGDAHFDDDELWLLQPKNNNDEEGTSLFAVAAHEFGHSLGLSHSSVKGALMFPWYQGDSQSDYVLPEDDRNGIQQMYGPKENKRPWARIPSYRPVETPPPTTSTSTTTTTKRPYVRHRHSNKHPNQQPGYTPYPRDPSKYPSYHPERPGHERPIYPNYPDRPNYPNPNRPNYPDRPYYPDRRQHHNTTHTHTTHTTHRPTQRPQYPNVRPEYPSYRPYHPTDRTHEHPRDKPSYPEKPTTVRPTTPSDKPDTCDTSYDAVALIRGELFIFKDRYHWRIGANGRYASYPIEISRMWPRLPKDFTHVDAVYERPDKKIAFFIGKELYLFDSQYLVPGYPRPLRDLGLPESLDKLDAAMVWGHNGKTYFYSGTMYWKFDEEEGHVEWDYPRDMSMWKGVGYNIDSVFQWKDGKTYFFKGKGFWKFNDLQMRVEHERQLPSAPFWMGCPSEPTGRRAPYRAPQAPGSTLRSPSSSNTHYPNILSLLTSILLVLLSYSRHS